MCNRVRLPRQPLAELAQALGASFDAGDADRYHARLTTPTAPGKDAGDVWPSDLAWILVVDGDERHLTPATWGLPGPKRKVINVRAEAVQHGALRARRPCALVAASFFEYAAVTGPGGRARKLPVEFRAASGAPLLLAGLAEPGDASTAAGAVFTTIMTDAVHVVAAVKERMPVVLSAAAADAWLRDRDAGALAPPPEGLLVAELPRLAPTAEQLSLFSRDDER